MLLVPITTNSLLHEMTDLAALADRPAIPYKTVQFSSYDRKSVASGQDGWFANEDFGEYLREEHLDGRTEHVMADINGPGAVVRLWSANPNGTIRFYFDGAAK